MYNRNRFRMDDTMIKKILSLLMCTFLLLNSFTVFAEDEATPTPEPEVTVPDALGLNAKAAVLIDAKTGMVLYQKNMNEPMYPASITKVLTIYIALEKLDPNATLTATNTAIDNIDRTSSHIWLDYGEQAPMIDFAYASMMASANDATNLLAEAVSGSQEEFAKLMNEVATSAGAKNSNFINAHGLPDENHKTTAYDMAMILRAAMKNNTFKEVFGAVRYDMAPTNKQSNTRAFSTGNEMLKNSKFKYEYATGGKIGWTNDAGYTMVNTATKDNMDLIGVVLGCDSSDARYEDMQKLFNYGFNNFKTVILSKELGIGESEIKEGKKVIGNATFYLANDLNVLLPMAQSEDTIAIHIEYRKIDEGENIEGYAVISVDGKDVGEIKLEKEMTLHDLSFSATKLPMIVNIINLISVGILGLFVILKFLVFIRRNTKLPD